MFAKFALTETGNVSSHFAPRAWAALPAVAEQQFSDTGSQPALLASIAKAARVTQPWAVASLPVQGRPAEPARRRHPAPGPTQMRQAPPSSRNSANCSAKARNHPAWRLLTHGPVDEAIATDHPAHRYVRNRYADVVNPHAARSGNGRGAVRARVDDDTNQRIGHTQDRLSWDQWDQEAPTITRPMSTSCVSSGICAIL